MSRTLSNGNQIGKYQVNRHTVLEQKSIINKNIGQLT